MMQAPYSSLQLDFETLPSLIKDKKQLPKKINEYVTEVNQEIINLEKEQYGVNLKRTPVTFKLRKVPTLKRNPAYGKSSSVLPVVMRLSTNSIRPINQTAFNQIKSFKSTTCLPNPRNITLKKGKLLEELKSIDEESAYMNQNLLTDMITYDDTEKRMNKQFKKIRTTKQRLLIKSDEYLKPEKANPFHPKHSNDFYSYLDQVIDKVNGVTSIDLFKKMKMLNDEKEKNDNNHFVMKNQKRHERVEKLLEETNQIKKRLANLS